MANIRSIEMYDVMYYDTTAPARWKNLWAYEQLGTFIEHDLGPGSNYSISLYSDPTGFDPGQGREVGMAWDWLHINDGSGVTEGWTIFGDPTYPGEPEHLLTVDQASVKIRYKLRAVDATPQPYEPNEYWYQIVNATHAVDHITYAGTSTTGTWAPIVTLKLPGVNNAMVGTNSVGLFSWLGIEENWELLWTLPDNSTRTFRPNTAVVNGTTNELAGAPYDGAGVEIKLSFPVIPVGMSGTHTLKLSLLPNDQTSNGFYQFDDDHSWVATITVNNPYMGDKLMLSFDTGVTMNISFST
jgi:hypothetical protein